MTRRKIIKYKLLVALAITMSCASVSAAEIEEVILNVDDQHFTFDILLQDLPDSLSLTSLSINTKANLFIPPANQEQFTVRFTTQNGEIIEGPVVQTLDSPQLDRWQDGALEEFTLSEISSGTWRVLGGIVHGSDRYVPCDRIGEIRLSSPGGGHTWSGNVIDPVPVPAMSLIVNPSTDLITDAGQIVDYQYVISNTGQVVLHDVAVSDDNVDEPPVCDFFAEDELAPQGELHSKVICTAQHTVTQDEVDAGGQLVNLVSVTADEVGPVDSTVKIPVGLFLDGFEGQGNSITVLDDTSCDVGRDSSIAIDAEGKPVIAYHDSIESTVKVIRCNDAACSDFDDFFSILDESTNGESSIAIGSDNLPVIAYQKFDGSGNYLNVGKCNDAACSGGDESLSAVDGPASDLGSHNSLAVGVDGHPVISYFDQEVLSVAKCNDPACTGGDETVTIVDASPGAPGADSSLAIGVDGMPVISYHQVDPGVLKVAKCDDPACVGGNETINVLDDSTDYAGRYTSIAISMDGFPIISYSNEYDLELRVVKCNDAACSGGDEVISVVDSSARGFTSIAVGDDGLPVIAYTGEGGQYALKVVKCNDQACSGNDETPHVVDPASVGYVSLAIGSDGLPIISYFDNEKRVLKVAHCVNSSCSE